MLQIRRVTGLLVAGVFLATGCSESTEYQDYSQAELSANADHDHDHGHGGVYGGDVFEVGDTHQFHAELVFDASTRDIAVYFYGNEVGKAVPASDFVFEIEAGSEETVLEATASPLEGETAESCSRYVVAGAALPADVTSEEKLNGHFHVTLGGSEYEVTLSPHSHDHDHDHADGDHAEHGEGHSEHEAGDAHSDADHAKP